jgi:5'-AMP-activated protein kinase regulatory beta subunit
MPKTKITVEFPDAQRVCLAGDFNGWDPEGLRLRRLRKGEDIFSATVEVPEGTHEFKFVIDGEWVCCPHAPRVRNELGTENSLMLIEA